MKSLVLKANQTLKKNRRNNKGFTLVELIIVIAIIAVLAAVLAPQYIRYVERSRYSTDLNAVNEIAHAMEVASVGDGITTPTGDSLTVTTTGDSDYDSVAAGTIGEAVNEICPEGSYTFVSDTFHDAESITMTLTNGVASFTAPAAP